MYELRTGKFSARLELSDREIKISVMQQVTCKGTRLTGIFAVESKHKGLDTAAKAATATSK